MSVKQQSARFGELLAVVLGLTAVLYYIRLLQPGHDKNVIKYYIRLYNDYI